MFLKNYFGREETKSVTKELVGSILEEEITEIDLEQNPILEKNIKDEKIGILDIRAKLNNNTNCNVEIQLVDQKNIEKRALYYWSKMYIESIKAGHDYSELEKGVVILIVDFELKKLKDVDHWITEWELRGKDYTNKILGLTLSVAIRNQKSNDIIFRNNVKKEDFVKDITYLKDMSKSIAIITKDDKEAEEVYNMLKDDFDIMLLGGYGHIKRDLVIVPSYTAKGLEFDSVIIYNDMDNKYTKEDKYLYYVACTRAQHNLIIYNGEE